MTSAATRLLLAASGAATSIALWEWVRRTPTARHQRWLRRNFRGRTVSVLGGPVVVVASLIGCALAAVVVAEPGRTTAVALGVVLAGAGAAGINDDLRGSADDKGLKGHLRALLRGQLTSGAVKVLVLAGSGLAAAVIVNGSVTVRAAADGLLIAGCANLVNLLDLRPGRAAKVAVAAFAGLLVFRSAAATPLAWIGGVAVAIGVFDVRERLMLGDGGANALGGALGVGLVVVGTDAARLAWLAALIALTLLSEVVSFSAIIAATPPLRWLDGLGRVDRGQRAGA